MLLTLYLTISLISIRVFAQTCKNGGFCPNPFLITGGCSKCICNAGSTGILCEQLLVDNCASNPCQNTMSFQCNNQLGQYSCTCKAGYTGPECEYETSGKCKSQPCQNGGTCTEDPGFFYDSFICTCPPQYKGSDCSIPVNACSGVNCGVGGTCSSYSKTKSYCTCGSNLQGVSCDQPIQTATFSPTCYITDNINLSVGWTSYDVTSYSQCQAKMTSAGKNFFLISGTKCYIGDSSLFTLGTADIQNANGCKTKCTGSSDMCAGGNRLQYVSVTIATDPNACSSSPCGSGGKCLDTLNGYQCVCADGKTGDKCQSKLTLCSNGRCKNGGTCYEADLGYTDYCICPEGFTGNSCDTELPCHATPCQNAALCDPITANCTCQSLYTGNRCQTYMTCGSSPCLNGGTCTDTSTLIFGLSYKCDCPQGWKGDDCEKNIDECALGIAGCQHESTCVDLPGSYECQCLKGTFGDHCEINPDDCIDGYSVCTTYDKNSNCTDGYDEFYCSCSPQWEGLRCETDVNECAVYAPCQHESSCLNLPGSFNCTCLQGTFGTLCEINPDDCPTVSSCHEPNGNCVDLYDDWRCNCTVDFTGQFCDLEMRLYEILMLIGDGLDTTDLISMMRDLEQNPSMVKDLVPFVLGTMSAEQRLEMSYDVEDMFLWAAFEEKRLDLEEDLYKWNDVVLGNCFTFNHMNNSIVYDLRSDGTTGGIEAAVKLNGDEYAPWTETMALMVFVHSRDNGIFSESVRFNALPGGKTSISVEATRYERLGFPYGVCVENNEEVKNYYYEGNYTTEGCLSACYQDYALETCGCMDARYPMVGGVKSCGLSDRKCVESVAERGDPAKWTDYDCNCPLPCKNQVFSATWTEAPFVVNKARCNVLSQQYIKENNVTCTGSTKSDYLIVKVFVPRMLVNIFKEEPAWTFNRLLSTIGGYSGLIAGMSIVTFFEFFFVIARFVVAFTLNEY